MGLSFRTLPEEEWPRLIAEGIEPFASHGLPPVAARPHWRMVVAERDGRIIALSSLRTEILNDWTVTPAARRNPALVAGLWRATKACLDQEGIPVLHTTVGEAQVEVQAMVERLGYVGHPGKVYVLVVDQCVLNGD